MNKLMSIIGSKLRLTKKREPAARPLEEVKNLHPMIEIDCRKHSVQIISTTNEYAGTNQNEAHLIIDGNEIDFVQYVSFQKGLAWPKFKARISPYELQQTEWGRQLIKEDELRKNPNS